MRLVSQDKTIDVPYEKGCVLSARVNCRDISKNQPTKIYFCADFTPREPIVLAEYSSQEKALRVMDVLRRQYGFASTQEGVWKRDNIVFQFPKDEDIELV